MYSLLFCYLSWSMLSSLYQWEQLKSKVYICIITRYKVNRIYCTKVIKLCKYKISFSFQNFISSAAEKYAVKYKPAFKGPGGDQQSFTASRQFITRVVPIEYRSEAKERGLTDGRVVKRSIQELGYDAPPGVTYDPSNYWSVLLYFGYTSSIFCNHCRFSFFRGGVGCPIRLCIV